MKTLLCSLLLFCSYSLFPQQSSPYFKKYNCNDIENATDFKTRIDADKVYSISMACSPKGQGDKNEVGGSSSTSKYYFQAENNIVWIQFQAVRDGFLEMTILPDSTKDDYDFLLFKGSGPSTIDKIVSKSLQPVRSNLARSGRTSESNTGLRFSAEQTHVAQGPNSTFSKSLHVLKGEIYYLALNNVYNYGGGTRIIFDYLNTKSISGIVSDAEGQKLAAEVVWENGQTGEEMAKTISDSTTGEFTLNVPYNNDLNKEYVLSVYKDNHIFSEKNVDLNEILKMKAEPIEVALQKFDRGKHTRLNNINFEGGTSYFLKSAYPSLRRLAKLMKRNPSLIIHIEGHTNGCTSGEINAQLLSEQRAESVKKYLLEEKISDNRITTEGLNCSKMLYPLSSAEKYLSLNRRVEIVVLDY